MGVSIVVAVAGGPRDTLEECLAALLAQRDGETEIVVVRAGPGPASPARGEVSWREAPAAFLIPQLWSLGMSDTRHDVVALTTSHFVPAPDWVARVRDGHVRRADAAAVGGAILPPRGGGSVTWATFFLRYSAYMVMRSEQEVNDLAGDNASYKRSALFAHPEFLEHGFWEHEFHNLLRKEGALLVFDPALTVTLEASFGFRGFVRQRFAHGQEYGRTRVAGRKAPLRLLAALLSLAVPFVLFARIARRVLQTPEYLGAFVACLPPLLGFILAWSAGEFLGYLSPPAPQGAVAARKGASA